MQGVTRKRRLLGSALEPSVELESIRSQKQRKSHFREQQREEIERVQQRLLGCFPLSALSSEQLRDFPFLHQGRQNCCTVVSMNHLAFAVSGSYDLEWKHAYQRLRQQVHAIDSMSTMYELYGRKLVPALQIVDLRHVGYPQRLELLQAAFQEQFSEHKQPMLVDAAAHTSLAIAFNPDSEEVLFVDTYGNTTADAGLWVVKLPLLAALCKEFGFVQTHNSPPSISTEESADKASDLEEKTIRAEFRVHPNHCAKLELQYKKRKPILKALGKHETK